MTDPAIRIEGLRKAYGGLVALDEVELTVGRGEIFGLVGPNGAGKTTLIRILVGALRPDKGRVSVLGLDARRQRWELRSLLGYMPQQAALYDDLSTRRNVEFFVAAHRDANIGDLANEALSLVELSDRAGDPVHTLSGGLKQRLSLACALAHKPELLLLDEPTAGVDPELRAAFWARFRSIADEGGTLVVSTHHMTEAKACDRIAVLRGGKVLLSQDPRQILDDGRATVRLWRAGRLEEKVVEKYPTALPAMLAAASADRVEVEQESLEEIVLRLIRSEGDHRARA